MSRQRGNPEAQSATFTLKADTDGRTVLQLAGRLDAAATARLWREMEHQFRRPAPKNLQVDASQVDYCDGSGLALLRWLSMGKLGGQPGHVSIQGLRPEFETLFQKFTPEDYAKSRPPAPEKSHLAVDVGRSAEAIARDLRAEISFVGEVTAGTAWNAVRRKAMRWAEIGRVFETAGVNALPIVSLISLLVGMIIAFEAAAPFAIFGAQIFIANMLAIIMTRELGPLMTAILLAGRSGSAFAAELGTMKVNEELDALETMGLNPIRFLVVQRLLAGLILSPLLTVYAIAVGLAGGVIVMLLLGFPIESIYQQMNSSITYRDILVGVAKGVVFGGLVAGVGCLRGMQTGKGPSAVGVSTTRAVVSGILLIILADAVFSVVLYFMKI